ncbi:16S rRNA (guanine(966)-N(2))-methyltransferase RsmD [Jannaschia seohaensis]|uniref:16S rRNA (Guanine966-N2)-methyltransferase n=1 Tax=Jannaschia seohaensis TaxID=475081 RepID=A0A2Y9A2Q3_9RHOB|nr:16S rRNA (guanine(966)-N(2))-methyltransferase RsmD [Jannaschia seohaensis]PWJ22207.1 16S rRNA (guanine966-N2)-methyltransferase [Jannaschia seohaensis]SSA38485.1 16S rRNA (guanine966-N2)-methyltransferase [Jannaschia seohaensis]
MRIVGGRWRGRRLASVGKGDAAARLRPTTDRVREAIFNLIQNGGYGAALDGTRVLDVFAGTGALGLEALSRGAAEATFIEQGRAALALLRENVALLDAPARILARDARRPGPGTPHDLILMDPPYGRGLGEAAMAALLAQGWVAPGALIVWEDAAAPVLPEGLVQLDSRTYGGTVVTLAERS